MTHSHNFDMIEKNYEENEIQGYKRFWYIEEVSENILQYQVSKNIRSKAGVLKYIIMEIPLKASVTEYQSIGIFCDTSIIIYSMTLEIQWLFCDTVSTTYRLNKKE